MGRCCGWNWDWDWKGNGIGRTIERGNPKVAKLTSSSCCPADSPNLLPSYLEFLVLYHTNLKVEKHTYVKDVSLAAFRHSSSRLPLTDLPSTPEAYLPLTAENGRSVSVHKQGPNYNSKKACGLGIKLHRPFDLAGTVMIPGYSTAFPITSQLSAHAGAVRESNTCSRELLDYHAGEQ